MSMTREEAIELLRDTPIDIRSTREDDIHTLYATAQMMAIDALLPVSREQVEKVRRGEWVDKGWDGDFSWKIDGRGHCWKVIECSQCQCKVSAQTNFCPNCGALMTDEAVQMVMERLEALNEKD